jgi:hypothetical protein
LITVVGRPDALWALDDEPLPDEPFDWSGVADRDREFVAEVLTTSDRVCELLFDLELRTVTRRILARVASLDPRPLRRHARPERCAAGLVWLAAHGNGALGHGSRLCASHLWAWCGVTDCSDRGRTLRRAAGLRCSADDDARWRGVLPLGDPSLLHSRWRASLIHQRDTLAQALDARRTFTRDADGQTAHLRTTARRPLGACKGVLAQGNRVMIVVGFGEELDDADFVALTVPDAHDLVRQLQAALDAPIPRIPPSGWAA